MVGRRLTEELTLVGFKKLLSKCDEKAKRCFTCNPRQNTSSNLVKLELVREIPDSNLICEEEERVGSGYSIKSML